MKNSSTSIQVDEPRDFINKGEIKAFVGLVNEDEIQEDKRCFKELPKTSKGIDVFNSLSVFLEARSPVERLCGHLY